LDGKGGKEKKEIACALEPRRRAKKGEKRSLLQGEEGKRDCRLRIGPALKGRDGEKKKRGKERSTFSSCGFVGIGRREGENKQQLSR